MKLGTIAVSCGVALSLTTPAGCASMGAATDRAKLVSTAAFDHRCPEERVSIVREKDDGMGGTGQYELEVCGTPRRYKRAGTLYYDAETGGPLGK